MRKRKLDRIASIRQDALAKGATHIKIRWMCSADDHGSACEQSMRANLHKPIEPGCPAPEDHHEFRPGAIEVRYVLPYEPLPTALSTEIDELSTAMG